MSSEDVNVVEVGDDASLVSSPTRPISSPMGGARGLLRNPEVAMFRSALGGSMD